MRGKLPQSGQYPKRDVVGIRYIVIHHSAVEVNSSAKDIALYDIGFHSWPGCSYTFVVRWDGTIEQAWDLDVMCYNVAGQNDVCLGICCPGDYTNRAPRPAQWNSAKRLINWLLATDLPGREVIGHRDIALPSSPTSCPGRLMEYWP